MCIPSGRNKVTFKAIAEALYFPLARLPIGCTLQNQWAETSRGRSLLLVWKSLFMATLHPVCLLIEILDKMKYVL